MKSKFLFILSVLLAGIMAICNMTVVNAEQYIGQKLLPSEYISKTYIKKVRSDGLTRYQQAQIIRRTEDNAFVYCLQPFVTIDNNYIYNIAREDYEVYLNITKEQWDRISLLAYYGYGYGDHTSQKWYAVTQVLIWRTAEPNSDIYFTNTLNGTRNDSLYISEIAEIENLVANHYKAPNFNNSNITIPLGNTITLNDSNGVLNNFKVSSQSNVSTSISDNSLSITATGTGEAQITLTKADSKYNASPIVYFSESTQDAMSVGSYDPIVFRLDLKVIAGKIEVEKTGENFVIEDNKFYYDDDLKLENVEFSLFADEDIITSDGVVHYKKGDLIQKVTTNVEGKAIFTDLMLGKYVVKETKSIEGYVIDEKEYKVELTEIITKSLNVTNKLKKGTLEFTKTDLSTGNPLPNTLIEIYTDKDELVFSGRTDENGKIVIQDLKYGKYYILEKEAPIGYNLNTEKMFFEIKEDGEVVKATMTNEAIKGTLEFTKTDLSTGKPLPNTLIEIYTEKDDLVFSGRTDENGKIVIENLKYGKYYILEKEAPEGYILNTEKMPFEIKENGEIVKATMTNEIIKGTLEFTKLDFSTSEPLSNTLIEIYTDKDELVFSGRTDENGKIVIQDLKYGKYYILEKEAPEGYILNTEKMPFEIKEDGEIVKTIMLNELKVEVPNTESNKNNILDIMYIVGIISGLGIMGYGIYEIFKSKKKK